MKIYFIKTVLDQTLVLSHGSEQDITCSIYSIFDANNKLADPNSLQAYDLLQLKEDNYLYRTLNYVCYTKDYLGAYCRPFLVNFYKAIRPMPQGPSNKAFCVMLKLLEHSFQAQNLSIIDKLKNHISARNHSIIDWFKKAMIPNDPVRSLNLVFFHFGVVEKIGLELLQNFNGDLSNIARAFDFSVKIISIPEMQVCILNAAGQVEITFLKRSLYYDILYPQKELMMMEDSNYKWHIRQKSLLNEDCQSLTDELRKSIKEKQDKQKALEGIVQSYLGRMITKACITAEIKKKIELLNSNGFNLQEVSQQLNENLCIYCNRVGAIILLECTHKICLPCLNNLISQQTNGYYVFNDFESKYDEYIFCRCKAVIRQDLIKTKLPHYKTYAENAEQRNEFKCGCGYKGTCKDFKMTCKHYCNSCLFQFIRNQYKYCSHCFLPFTQTEMTRFFSIFEKCDGCFRSFKSIKAFPHKICEHRLCFECISMNNGLCIVDRIAFPYQDFNYGDLLMKQCSQCSSRYSKFQELEMRKLCFCNICEECQSSCSVNQCAMCSLAFSESLTKYLHDRYVNNSFVKECSICLESFPINFLDELINCCHIFCNNCLQKWFNSLLSQDNLAMLSHCPYCNANIYPGQLDRLLPQDAITRYTSYSLQLRGLTVVSCPKCKESFEPTVQRKVTCVKKDCKFVFCKICQEAYHESGDCQEGFINERIKDLEKLQDKNGITQCPGCRLPYIMDENCKHVKCMNKDCGLEFCFLCACIRSPTLAHGTHYHRPSCKLYNNYHGLDDLYDEKCSECAKNRKLCDRPQDLKVQRRVEASEATLGTTYAMR